MSFGRQVWTCAAAECERQGVVSVVVLLQGPGGRKSREKGNTKALRLCKDHARFFVEQQSIAAVRLEIEGVCRKVVPEAWTEPKPKRVK